MATTQNAHTGNGSTVDYSFTFPYLKSTDIKVSLDGVDKTITDDYTLHNATTIRFNSAPGSGVIIRIYRSTASDNLASTFYPGSAIRSQDLNDNYTQNLYVTQEGEYDAASAADYAKRFIIDGDGSNTSGTEEHPLIASRPPKPQGVPFAITTANSAVTTANAANTKSDSAVTTANAANTTAAAANATAGTANTTSNTASTNATNAVNTANTASTNATNAVNTANAADAIADSAKLATDRLVATTSNNGTTWTLTGNNTNASTDPKGVGYAVTQAEAAVSTANSATTTANNAVTTANAADTIADTAKLATDRLVATTANNGTTWTLTGNNTNASTDPKGVGYAVTQAEAAVTTANAASAAVADAVTYTQKANEAAIQGFTPAENADDNMGYYEVTDSTNLVNEGWVYNSVHYKIQSIPSTFEGAPGLTVRLSFDFNSASGADASNQKVFTYMSYFANDPESRYLPNPRPFVAGTPVSGQINYYTVKVAAKNAFHRYNGTGSSNGFLINGEQGPFLEWTPGITYRFDQSDSSNANHTLKFYEEADKTTAYTSGVTLNGTPGSSGAYTQITATDTLPTVLHYMCHEQAHEGNGIQTNTAFDRTALPVIDAGNFTLTSSSATVSTIYDGGAFT